MNFLELKNISEKFIDLINPSSNEKIIKLGKVVKLKQGARILDYACGFGEMLVLWAKEFCITGTGIDIREYACERAREKLKHQSLQNQVEIVCGDASKYEVKEQYDAITFIGSSFVFGNAENCLKETKEYIKDDGRIVIGEPYLLKTDQVPKELKDDSILTEYELLTNFRKQGFELEYIIRSSQEEWDDYVSSNWVGLIHWLKNNKNHPNYTEVLDHLHESQKKYTKYEREYMGWAIYVLKKL